MKIEKRHYQITCNEPLLATVPAHMNVRELMNIANRKDERKKLEPQILGLKEDEINATHTIFFRDEKGIYLCNYQFKGFLKEAANNLKKEFKIACLRDKLTKFVFVKPRWIWLAEDSDGVLERTIRVNTPQGQRVALATSEVLYEATFKLEIWLLSNPHKITWKVIETLLDYGQFIGQGRWRNGDFGSFVWEKVKK